MNIKIQVSKILNRTLLIFYVLFMVVIPLIVLFVGFNRDIVKFSSSSQINFGRILYIFVSLPAYSVYAVMIVKEYFPEKNKNAFILFIPILFPYLVNYFSEGRIFFEMLMKDSLPLYLGINIMFFAGLLKLIIKNIKGEAGIIKKLFILLIIFFILFFPAYCIFIIGYELSIKHISSYMDKVKELLKFFSSIILVIIFHYKILLRMFNEGKL